MFGILGAPDVDWMITIEGGRMDAPAGSTIRATIALRPKGNIDARRVMAALVGTEEYQYREREIRSSGTSSTTHWSSNELHRQELQLSGPGQIGAGDLRSGPVEFTVPADAAPSLESSILCIRWHIAAWIDVGGRDPKAERQVIVPLTTAQLNPADAGTMGPQVQVPVDGQPVSFWTQPAPLRAGATFSGALEMATPIPLNDVRIDLKLNVATRPGGTGAVGATLLAIAGLNTTADNGISESQLLWRGALTDGGATEGWHRYLFAGQLALSPIVTAIFPHGIATATLDVVTSRRLRPDAHIIRPVAIVTG